MSLERLPRFARSLVIPFIGATTLEAVETAKGV